MQEVGGPSRLGRVVKRIGDVIVAALLLVLLSPVLIATSVAVLLRDGRPVLFRQRRPGLDGQPFELRKFRTMRSHLSGEEPWSSDGARVTTLGRFLRRTSLDEFPGLWNVLRGDMSLVGPRPLLEEYLPRYNSRQALRHSVRPGITGLAQVTGRRSLTLGQRLELDVRYVEKWSIALDLRILLKTLVVPFTKGDDPDQSLEEVDDIGFLIGSAQTPDSTVKPWESGSFFPAYRGPQSDQPWMPEAHLLLATGRQAIAAAFLEGQRQLGWQRLLIPNFFCPDVAEWLPAMVPTDTYRCSPMEFCWPEELRDTDAVLAVAYFGQRPPLETGPPARQLILDLTHDPLVEWAQNSGAAYTTASLRKTLPVPDGAIVWSPMQLPLSLREQLGPALAPAGQALQAMELKANYLEGQDVDKQSWRAMFSQAETALMAVSALSNASDATQALLPCLPVSLLSEQRKANISELTQLVPEDQRVKVWPSTFGLILLLADEETRDQMRQELVKRDVYSAVLWTHDEDAPDPGNWDFGRRMLHIHTDFRYTSGDIQRVGEAIRQSIDNLWGARA